MTLQQIEWYFYFYRHKMLVNGLVRDFCTQLDFQDFKSIQSLNFCDLNHFCDRTLTIYKRWHIICLGIYSNSITNFSFDILKKIFKI